MQLEDLWEGEMAGVEVAGTKVLLVNIDGEIRAYRNRCPHQAWALSEGDLDDGTITCVNHMWMFDARSGQGVNPDNCALTSYPAQVTEDGVIMVDVG
jgi:toluene monooxygenase system ferredoxin subunit